MGIRPKPAQRVVGARPDVDTERVSLKSCPDGTTNLFMLRASGIAINATVTDAELTELRDAITEYLR